MNFSDFREHQHGNLQWLIDQDIVIKDSDGYLKINAPKVYVLKDLYEHDVICPKYYDDKLKSIVDEWCRSYRKTFLFLCQDIWEVIIK